MVFNFFGVFSGDIDSVIIDDINYISAGKLVDIIKKINKSKLKLSELGC